jgi:hypothetical protein
MKPERDEAEVELEAEGKPSNLQGVFWNLSKAFKELRLNFHTTFFLHVMDRENYRFKELMKSLKRLRISGGDSGIA